MTKKEKLLTIYKILYGFISIDDLKVKLPLESIEELTKAKQLMPIVPTEMKQFSIWNIEIALDLLEKEKGEDYTEDDLREKMLIMMRLTDPNNKISPFELEDIPTS